MVAGAGRDAHERKPVRGGHRGHDGQRSVTAGHSQCVRAAGCGRIGQLCQIVALAKEDYLDALFTRPLGKAGPPGRAIT
jgi:hypothetical protein